MNLLTEDVYGQNKQKEGGYQTASPLFLITSMRFVLLQSLPVM
jgi:hypothetical protein